MGAKEKKSMKSLVKVTWESDFDSISTNRLQSRL